MAASPNLPQPEDPAQLAFRRTHGAVATPTGHTLSVRVYYEDTDAAGIVYHANYLKFAERGRTELLRSIGFGQRRLREESGVGFAVRRCHADYRATAHLDDALTVATSLAEIGAATLSLHQEIRRDDVLLAVLDVVVACIGSDGRPRRLPASLRARLADGGLVPAIPLSK